MHKFFYLTVFTVNLFLNSSYALSYEEKEYCREGQVIKCLIGPYVHECHETGLNCNILNSNSAEVSCFDPRVRFFQCKEGLEFVRWIKGSCQNGLVEGAVCN